MTRRIEDARAGRSYRLVGRSDGQIVADGTLEIEGHGWGEGVGEIRLMVARSHRRTGVGTYMARELYFLAASRRLTRIVARMMRPQKAARAIFRNLGFRDEFVIPKHVLDRNGEWQDRSSCA